MKASVRYMQNLQHHNLRVDTNVSLYGWSEVQAITASIQCTYLHADDVVHQMLQEVIVQCGACRGTSNNSTFARRYEY